MKQSVFWITVCSAAALFIAFSECAKGQRSAQNSKPTGVLHNRLNQGQNPIEANRPQQKIQNYDELLRQASKSEGKLTMDLLAESNKLVNGSDLVLGTFSIWGVTSMIHSAAEGLTASQLSHLLSIDSPTANENHEYSYQAAFKAFNKRSSSVETQTLNLIASFEDEPIAQETKQFYQSVYHSTWLPIDKWNKDKSVAAINDWAGSATKDRVNEIITSKDLDGMSVFLASATFFRGRWLTPFNVSTSKSDVFKNEFDDIVARNVPMMRLRGLFKFGYYPKIQCQMVEMPYADHNTSMIVFLPQRRIPIQVVLDKMRGSSLAELLEPEIAEEEEVDITLPRFTTQSGFNLNKIFVDLKASAMFSPNAELSKMSNNTFISKISHVAEIETSEEGTTASAVTSAVVSYKQTVNSFQANRPFIYFINHVPSRLVLFAGKIEQLNKYI